MSQFDFGSRSWATPPCVCVCVCEDAQKVGVRNWRRNVFIDESRFSLFHSDGRILVRHGQGDRLRDDFFQTTEVNRCPSVTVCGAIHRGGRTELVVLDGPLNRRRYIRLLRDNVCLWATDVFGRNLCMSTPHAAL